MFDITNQQIIDNLTKKCKQLSFNAAIIHQKVTKIYILIRLCKMHISASCNDIVNNDHNI